MMKLPMNTKIRFRHFHDGNDPWVVNTKTGIPERVRGSAIYATSAALVDLRTGNVIEEVMAYCSPRDVPSRKKGREITTGRLEAKLNPNFHKDKAAKRRASHNPVPAQKTPAKAYVL